MNFVIVRNCMLVKEGSINEYEEGEGGHKQKFLALRIMNNEN